MYLLVSFNPNRVLILEAFQIKYKIVKINVNIYSQTSIDQFYICIQFLNITDICCILPDMSGPLHPASRLM